MREAPAGAFAILGLVPCGRRPGRKNSGSCAAHATITGATVRVRSSIFRIRSAGRSEQSGTAHRPAGDSTPNLLTITLIRAGRPRPRHRRDGRWLGWGRVPRRRSVSSRKGHSLWRPHRRPV